MPDRFTFIVALFALLVAGLALFRTSGSVPDAPPRASTTEGGEVEEHGTEEHGELAPAMASLQRFAEKLHLAGEAGNWELASFYEHEIEETAEPLIAGGFEADGHEVGPLVERWLLPAVERVGEAIGAADRAAFGTAYGELVTACNACHAATGHGFVRIVVPDGNPYPSQDFAP